MITNSTFWLCPSCKVNQASSYCSSCGEARLLPHDLTLRGFLELIYNGLCDVDTKFLHSLRLLLMKPGELTKAYVSGLRMPYVRPFQLFLIINVLFFAVQSLTTVNVFSTTLFAHLHEQDWSSLAESLVSERVAKLKTTVELYRPVFDTAVVVNAKSLVILMVLPLTLMLPILFFRARRPFVTHLVFSLHLYAFLLLLFCLSLLISAVDEWSGGAGLHSARMDNLLTIFNLMCCVTYLYLSIGTAYDNRGAIGAVKSLILTFAISGIVVGYRFLLFIITLYTTYPS